MQLAEPVVDAAPVALLLLGRGAPLDGIVVVVAVLPDAHVDEVTVHVRDGRGDEDVVRLDF